MKLSFLFLSTVWAEIPEFSTNPIPVFPGLPVPNESPNDVIQDNLVINAIPKFEYSRPSTVRVYKIFFKSSNDNLKKVNDLIIVLFKIIPRPLKSPTRCRWYSFAGKARRITGCFPDF